MKIEWKALEERAFVGFWPPSPLPTFPELMTLQLLSEEFLPPQSWFTCFRGLPSLGSSGLKSISAHRSKTLRSHMKNVCVPVELQKPNGNCTCTQSVELSAKRPGS